MQRIQFTKNFSKRLLHLMQNKGYQSTRSKAGVDVTKLASVADCSYQMARRYVLGEALPELEVIPRIAEWLDVSASWLMFGEKDVIKPDRKSLTIIEIETEVLRYILNKCSALLFIKNDSEHLINYITDMIYDASHLNTTTETVFKIIDMMINSATKLTDGLNSRIKA